MDARSDTSEQAATRRPSHRRNTSLVDEVPAVPSSDPISSVCSEEVEMSLDVKHIIGSGAFGVVYMAEMTIAGSGSFNEIKGKLVAVKKVLQDKRYKNRELALLSEVDHPNIVGLYNHFISTESTGMYLNLVLEYLPETLHSVIKSKVKDHQTPVVPELTIKLYMYQLLRSLAYCHTLGICHRDIKPHNVLVDPETHVVKLCDFGSAKRLMSNESNVSYICSRYYRAPELIFGATEYTTAIDVWSAGCLMAELVTGDVLFRGENQVGQLVEIFRVLGTPSKEEILEMNKNHSDFNFPVIQRKPWDELKAFSGISTELLDLLSLMLKFSPVDRISPAAALCHPFFNEIRMMSPSSSLPDGRPLPPLLDFTSQEHSLYPELIKTLSSLSRRGSCDRTSLDGFALPQLSEDKMEMADGEFDDDVEDRLRSHHHPFNVIAEGHHARMA